MNVSYSDCVTVMCHVTSCVTSRAGAVYSARELGSFTHRAITRAHVSKSEMSNEHVMSQLEASDLVLCSP